MKTTRILLVALAVLALPGRSAIAADSLPAAKQQVRTGAKNDVQAQIAGADASTVMQVSANNTAQSTGGGWVLPAIVQSALPTYASNGNMVGLTVDASGRLYVVLDSTALSAVNLTKIGGSAIAIGQAAMAASLPVVIASDQSNLPANIKQINGSTLALGQTTMSASLPVVLSSNQSTIAVSQGAPTGAATNRAAPVSIASAGTTVIVCKGSLAVSQHLVVYQIKVTGAAMARCVAQYNDNASLTKFGDLMTSPAVPEDSITFPAGFAALTTSSTVTTQQIEMSCTNFDVAAQDFGCSVSYCQAASGC